MGWCNARCVSSAGDRVETKAPARSPGPKPIGAVEESILEDDSGEAIPSAPAPSAPSSGDSPSNPPVRWTRHLQDSCEMHARLTRTLYILLQTLVVFVPSLPTSEPLSNPTNPVDLVVNVPMQTVPVLVPAEINEEEIACPMNFNPVW